MFKMLFILISSISLAFGTSQGSKKNFIKEIRKFLEVSDTSNTCLDEYFKRRKQLGLEIGLSPAVILGTTLGGVYGSTLVLGTGAMQEIISIVHFFHNQSLIQLIYESDTIPGEVIKKYFLEFRNLYPHSPLTQRRFIDEISYLNNLGILCDGSLVEATRFKKGRKLKQILATKKEIFHYLSQIRNL